MKMDAMGIVVADMAAALAFYRAMGLDIPSQADTEAHVEVTIADGFTLMLDTTDVIHSFEPDWQPGTGTIGLAFAVDTPAEVDANHARMVAAGYRSRLEPFDAWWGQRYASVYDPDGNGVDIAAPLPPAEDSP
jgi:catechol 2,3-dioxygenase-like lactoylglutathione lyase family enzyme